MSKLSAIGYLRVSTQEQADTGYGLDAQDKAVRDYCRREQLRLARTERDEGISGSNGLDSRVGLAVTLDALESGQAKVLVVASFDRLARDLVLQEVIIDKMRKKGVRVVSVREGEADDDPQRVLIRQVMGAFAQYERSLIRARMMAGKSIKRARGGYCGGQVSYGKRAEGGEVVLDEDEAKIVAKVRALRRKGVSYRGIAQTLTDEGYRPRRAREWHAAQVRRIALGS